MNDVSLTARCDRIRARLEEISYRGLRRVGWFSYRRPREVFGERKHQFQLHNPLTTSEVEEFETKHGIQLPEDYRAFLIHVGDGGVGPYYGLKSLYEGPVHVVTGDDPWPDYRWLSRECPLRTDLPPSEPEWLVALGGEDWEDRIDRNEWHPYQGSIPLCDVGCGYYFVLPLSGTSAGRVCGVMDPCCDPPLFLRHQTFLDWYEAWMEAVYTENAELFDGTSIFSSRRRR